MIDRAEGCTAACRADCKAGDFDVIRHLPKGFAASHRRRWTKIVVSPTTKLTLALYQPDIPQNAGTMLRMCACLGIGAALIEPAGFPVSDKHFRRAGMDYLDLVEVERHVSFAAFEAWRHANGPRLVLLTTRAETAYTDLAYRCGDVLLVGRESAGVPETVHASADARVHVPMRPTLRSLNVAVAAAMVVGEALRQIRTT